MAWGDHLRPNLDVGEAFGAPDCGHSDIRAMTRRCSALPCGGKDLIAEITWDLIMSDDMPFVEGCYRLEGGEWQVMTARKSDVLDFVEVRNVVRWKSGVTGLNIAFPSRAKVSRQLILEVMAHELGITEWREVQGPDSMVLR